MPPTASPDSATSLPIEVLHSAQRGELQTVVKWLGEGGSIDAVCLAPTNSGQASAVTLLHATASVGQLEMTEELLKLGASVDLPSSHGLTALMAAAQYGHLPSLHVLLQHSANPVSQNIHGGTSLMSAAYQGHEGGIPSGGPRATSWGPRR